MEEIKSAAPVSGIQYFQTSETLEGIEVKLRDFEEEQPAQEVKQQNWERQTSTNPFKETITLNKYLPACLSLNHLKPYFDVSTKSVIKRLLLSLIPFNKKFFNEFNEKPDLYGPFWVITTLIATLFISSNVARFINWPKDTDFYYSFSTVPVAASVLYGVGFGMPALIKTMLNLYGSSQGVADGKSLFSAIGIYGYSFTTFILTVFLCGCLKWDWVQWILMAYSGITSIGFLWTTYWEDFKQNLEKKLRWTAVGVVCVVQLALLLVFKFYFFSKSEYKSADISNQLNPTNSTNSTL